MAIRKMLARDITDLDQQFIDQGWPTRRAVLATYFKEQTEGQRTVLVATQKSQVVGYVTLLNVAPHGPFKGEFPEIADFNVFEKYQRLGFGNQLFTAIEQVAAQQTKTITIGVGLHSGYGPAQRLYVKHGFIPDGSGVWFNDQPLTMNAVCQNNDDLVLYLTKQI